ncbi:MAG: lipid II flippase MurJ [Acidimicrobiales bacterium]
MTDSRSRSALEGAEPVAVESGAQVKNSMVVARWMIVSRVTGFLRLAALAAVLGPTFFGNLVQSALFLPVISYEVLSGSLCGPLLIPPLVRHVDRGDVKAQERLAGGFLGVVLAALGALVALLMIAGPLLVRVLTLGVASDVTRSDLIGIGWPLLVLTLPQAVLYAVAEIGAAVQNAHGVFGRPAAAPVVGNLGVAIVIIASGFIFGTGTTAADAGMDLVLFLGLGTTIAVALQAWVQLRGARLCGVRIRPRAGWADPEVREIVGLAKMAVAQGAIQALRFFGMLVAAGTVAGGVVAFQIALTFVFFAAALGGDAMAISALPGLSRLHNADDQSAMFTEWRRVLRLSLFLLIPMCAFFLVAAWPIARMVAVGEMNTVAGITLLATSLIALAPATIGHGGFRLATQASYAQRDSKAPLISMLLRAAVTIVAVVIVTASLDGRAAILVTGIGVSVADLLGFGCLVYLFERTFGTRRQTRRGSLGLGQALLAGAVAGAATYAIGVALSDAITGRIGEVLVVGLLAVVAAGLYLVIQRLLRSEALSDLHSGLVGSNEPEEATIP